MKATSRTDLISLIASAGSLQEKGIAEVIGISAGRLSNWKAGRDELNNEALSKLVDLVLKHPKLSPMTLDEISKLPAKASEASALREEAKYGKPVVHADPKIVVQWLIRDYTEEQLQKEISAAIGAGKSNIARTLLDLLDERRASSAAAAETEEALDVGLAGIENEPPKLPPKSATGGPSGPSGRRRGDVSPESKARHAPQAPAPVEPEHE